MSVIALGGMSENAGRCGLFDKMLEGKTSRSYQIYADLDSADEGAALAVVPTSAGAPWAGTGGTAGDADPVGDVDVLAAAATLALATAASAWRFISSTLVCCTTSYCHVPLLSLFV